MHLLLQRIMDIEVMSQSSLSKEEDITGAEVYEYLLSLEIELVSLLQNPQIENEFRKSAKETLSACRYLLSCMENRAIFNLSIYVFIHDYWNILSNYVEPLAILYLLLGTTSWNSEQSFLISPIEKIISEMFKGDCLKDSRN